MVVEKTWDEMNDDELYLEVIRRDWNIGHTAVSSYGVVLTFREHYTSDFPGMVTREFFGSDRADAMRTFLKDFESRTDRSTA